MGRQGPCMLRTRKCARVQTWARHVLSLAVALIFCAAPTLTTTGACSSPSAPALDRIGVRKGCEVVGKHGKHPHGSAHLPQSTQIALALRLRGGHRMPNKKKRNALEQHRTSRRIHSTNRPRDQKRQEQRRAAFQQLEEDDDEAEDVSFNLTEAMLNVSNPKLRLWETTMGKTMNQIHAFKKRCPEVWEEEEKCRMDQVANMAIDEWRAMVDETDDEEVEHKRAQDPDLQKKQAISHYNLGMCYENGYGVEGVDIGKAFTHYRLSAELGHPEGMCNVGCCYLEGHGCAYDEAKGFRWIQKAAEAGSFEGSLNLGLCYRRGVGVPVNQQLAVHFFNASAVNKHPDGMYAMAMCHQQGYAGLTPNPAL
eukprot:CAMPEP_0177698976 /NCGR_PEP_ID=MMETSP0484_2-20121128/5336_1 /TAXON_ID=354590 /ORGANISM="Rhodomonas lens, Strain RHODO" /LENGTH=365 /DNA_ID=CAMNT_0019210121 /DNA_START=29 /DNA_END=1122 /DNA_ORIENTATION=+